MQGEAKAKKEQADKVNIHDAALQGKANEIYPGRVNVKNWVTVPRAPLAAADSVRDCGWVDSVGTCRTLCTTQHGRITAKCQKSSLLLELT